MQKGFDISKLSEDAQWELLELLEERQALIDYNRMDTFEPYPFQKDFYTASKMFKRRFLCAANRVGKSYSEAVEVAYHLTGKYPEWWEGHKFDHPILAWAVGITGDSTRKVLQKELFGTAMAKDTKEIGKGSIPRDCIDFDNLEKDGHIIKMVKIKHHNEKGDFDGWSTIEFRSTQQGEHVLMGATVDYIWLDEEDPYNSMKIYAQCVTRTATTGGLVTITATPENGLTQLVAMFMGVQSEDIEQEEGSDEFELSEEDKKYLYFQNATWDDAPHLDEETKKELLASIPDWQHEMRTRGIPIATSGLVYGIDEKSITTNPFDIPTHWRRICAIDIGVTHPTAAVWTAYDAQNDCIYITDVYCEKGGIPSMHGTAINAKGTWIPVILPHDADNVERGSGKTVAQYYKEAGVNVMPETFYNPGGKIGKRDNYVEPGLIEMNQRMATGRLKVFATCGKFFEEMRRYRRKDGKIIKEFDDVMDAARYSALSVVNRGISEGEANAGYNSSVDDNWNYNY